MPVKTISKYDIIEDFQILARRYKFFSVTISNNFDNAVTRKHKTAKVTTYW